MKLTKVKIENYKSIINSTVDLFFSDNILSLIGQNESGKSSVLESLRDFYAGKFDEDSFPYGFNKDGSIKQIVQCTFDFEKDDSKQDILSKIIDFANREIYDQSVITKEDVLDRISNFSITYDGQYYEFDTEFINRFSNSLKWNNAEASEQSEEKPETSEENNDELVKVVQEVKEPPSWDTLHHDLSQFFVKEIIPEIIFFEGGDIDILPDFISINNLENKENDGWIAVDRLQKCIQELNNDADFSFKKLSEKASIQRRDIVNKSNEYITADFKTDFSQKIHGIEEDSLKIIFATDRRKEEGDAEDQDYLDFAVETKQDNPLPIRMRSKGMIWYLSFWLALKSLKEKKSIILIDEPDRNLHINAQKDLMNVFEKISKKFNHQIIYATHAPSLVPIDLIYRIYLVFNDKKSGTFCENILKTQIGNSKNKQEAISLVNYAIGCEVPYQNMVFKNKNVILEGTSDFMYFQAMSKIFKKKIDYAFIPGVGTKGSKLNPLISICIGYNLNWCVVLDGDASGIAKFDEIKTSVFANDDGKAKLKVKNLENGGIIEDLFTVDDIILIADGKTSFTLSKKPSKKDNLSYIGKDRKNTFAKLFLEKATSNKIQKDKLSKEVVKSFEDLFTFIETSFKNEAI